MSSRPSSSRRRWPRRVGLVALALLLLAGLTGYVLHERLPEDELAVVDPGALSVAEAARGTHSLGGHEVRITGDGVEIADADGVVWSSPAGSAFVAGATGEVDWTEHRGYFWPEVDHEETWPAQRIDSVTTAGDALVLRGRLTGDNADADLEIRLRERKGGGVTASVRADDVDALQWSSARSKDAGVHGFGEQFDDFDLSRRLLPIVAREQGVGRGEQPLTYLADVTNKGAGGTRAMTYAAWSSYVTDDLQGVRLDPRASASHAFAVADTRYGDRVGLEVWAPRLEVELTRGETPVELIRRQVAGPSRPALAGWTQRGAIVGIQGGTEKVRAVVADLREAGVALAGVWLQDWTGQRTTDFGDRLWWTWQLDEGRYPGWVGLVADLRQQGIRTTTYVNPWLVDASPRQDEGIANLWARARDNGYLVRDPDGGPYLVDQGGFEASLVDLTNAEARDWFAGVIADNVLADGVDGFMADFAEGLPMDAELADGEAAQLHNRWPALWAQTVRQACEQAGKPDCVTWLRAGSLGMDADTPAFWNGDQTVTWSADDGLASALLGTFSAGVSGWPVVHSDLGGYTSINAMVRNYVRDDELLARWGEYAAFGPLMRSHEGNRPAENRQVYDASEREAFARNSRIFAALAPYRSAVLREAATTGVPAVRHTWVNFPDSDAATRDDQFFLGDALLVAPVLETGADDVEVSFPPGEWIHLVTGTSYDGDRRTTVAAPIGTPAAFVRADHPMADDLVRAVSRAVG